MNGILNINKPQGKTSFSTVAAVRSLTGQRRVGHAGTLDPEATGVLPVCLGQGTRVAEFLMGTSKVYRAQIELGRATDTYDASGRTTQQADPSTVRREHFSTALASFHGLTRQTPPMYSALKYQGQRLYELARAGIEVERKSRPVRIDRLELTEWEPPLATIEVTCGKGTYIRSLAHDLGQLLGCGAHLKRLARLRYGPFDIESAISLPQFEAACRHGYWQRYLYPVDIALLGWEAIIVSETQAEAVRNGNPIALEGLVRHRAGDCSPRLQLAGASSEEHCRAYTLDGLFLGVLRFNPESAQWQPKKVFRTPEVTGEV